MKDNITIANLADYYQNEFKVEQKLLSHTVTDNIKDVLESIDFYNDEKDIANAIDAFIAQINQERSSFKSKIIVASTPQSTTKKATPSTKKQKVKTQEKQPHLLNKFPNSLMVIKRFASLMKNQKPKEEFLKLLKKIKKDMIDITIKKADIGTAIVLEIQALLNSWLIDKNKKPDTELKQVFKKAITLLQEYKVNPWATLQKYAITNIDNNTQEFKTKLQNRKNKLQKTMNNNALKNLNPKESVLPLAGLGGIQTFNWIELGNGLQVAKWDIYSKEDIKNYTLPGYKLWVKMENINPITGKNTTKGECMFVYAQKESEGLQGTTIYKPKMPVWVNRLKEFVHKSDKIKSYHKDKKTIVGLLRKIQTEIINLAIRKADKGSELINQIQHLLIDSIKAKKWHTDKAKKLAKKAVQFTEKYKINPSSTLLRKALKEPNEAVQQAKKLKGDYKYRKLIKSTAHGNPVPPLTANPVKKKS